MELKKKKATLKRHRVSFDILTIFPKILDSYLNESMLARALKTRLIKVKTHDLRKYSSDRHKKVDDSPFGGGPGMVLKVEPIYKAIKKIKKSLNSRTILFSIRGKKLDSFTAKRLAKHSQLILICGRYEGVDERVSSHIADEEISIGDYVLSGGELPAMVLIEAVSRYLPGFLGKYESLEEVKGSYQTYTKPAEFKPGKGVGWKVPPILLSGNHKKIQEWRLGKKSPIGG
ncbi:MAG: tRNA (guanine37-N1)-methyltransferase [Parcubacteria group bacterium Gr01-1014_20]|nr:MAG: tRNA (guanine37-N1)-methyltransferase [Parcubacteria group bacterium Gr01-1014_20]